VKVFLVLLVKEADRKNPFNFNPRNKHVVIQTMRQA